MTLTQLLDIAKVHKNIYIAGHIHPDGDCVGATMAMVQLFENAGVAAKVLLMESPEGYSHLGLDQYVQHEVPEEIDLFISLDASDVERLGDFGPLVEKAVMSVNIDHHVSNTRFAKENFVDDVASSTCEMVFNMIDQEGLMNKSIAEALYTGIIYDTGAFKHSNTKPSTHMAAAELITYGIDYTWMTNKMFFEKPIKSFKAHGRAYDRLETYLDDQVVVSYLTLSDFEELNISKSHTESIVQFMNEVEGIQVAMFFYATDAETYKISLRSKGKVDVCQVAGVFGGGGHIKASGASYTGTVEEAIPAVLKEIEKQLG